MVSTVQEVKPELTILVCARLRCFIRLRRVFFRDQELAVREGRAKPSQKRRQRTFHSLLGNMRPLTSATVSSLGASRAAGDHGVGREPSQLDLVSAAATEGD